ncbi:LytR family transcriptional regulator [Lentzea tibetensis]|uniref:LytR family transcriptional regulator n=1 Tax=Lentzea tibetensis TaxID=2591470 RepID=A0A563EU26_9PSEU|nr:LytR C-terminal domain-containing protein [Lentzea tibetensis]TWP51082.1 LytR family transcriptional regulator [Lentzea tibetensis]
MSSPDTAPASRPAKAAGFALLGVAAVALVIGVVSLFSGGSSDTPPPAAQSSTAPPASASASASEQPSSQPPATTTTPPTTTATPATTSTPPASNPPAQVTKVAVRVYNNSTITGLAARASDDVKRAGWEVSETGNYSQGQIPTTTVYFRPGTDEEASARALGDALKARVEPRFDGINHAAAGVILIVTNDYKGSGTNK